MARIAVRHVSTSAPASPVRAIALGLGLGALVGFLVGEIAGPVAGRAVRRKARAAPRPRAARLVAAAQAVLDDDLMLRDCRLSVVAAGPGRIALHGWVADRRSRARAAHLVSDAVQADAIINCLQVHGEDDRVPSTGDGPDQRLA